MSTPSRPLPGTIRPRHLLLVATVALTVVGALCVLSAADGASSGTPFGYFFKAVLFGALGTGLMLFIGRGGLGGLALAHRLTLLLLAVGFAGVLFVLIPTPITPMINGARRWISLPGMTIQPSEILKPALVLYLAMVLAREPWRINSLSGLRAPLLVCAAALGLVAKEDLGSALVTGGVVMVMLFAAGAPGRVLGSLLGAGALGAAALTAVAPERIERIAVFLNPFEDRYGAGFQISNGLFAISTGGVAGRGIGAGIEKHILPEPQTDFILAVITEEVGLIGITLIMALYVAIVVLGFRIARGTQDPYERLVATGLTSIVMCQAALNIWVVLGIAPLTGVPLPLVSAGGTSQLILLGVVGLLLDIDRRSTRPRVPLVLPGRPPQARPAVAEIATPPRERHRPQVQVPHLRVLDRRPSTAQAVALPAAERQGPAEVTVQDRRPMRRSSAPQHPPIVEWVGDLALLADGSVLLPSGKVGRPRQPFALPDGRVLLPDGHVVSRERAVLAARRQTPSA